MKTGITMRPVITEKSLREVSRGWYTFAMETTMRKETIKSVVAKVYGVTVVDVHTIVMHGKMHKVGKRQRQVALTNWKKVMVKLKSGQSIDAFSLSGQDEEKK